MAASPLPTRKRRLPSVGGSAQPDVREMAANKYQQALLRRSGSSPSGGDANYDNPVGGDSPGGTQALSGMLRNRTSRKVMRGLTP